MLDRSDLLDAKHLRRRSNSRAGVVDGTVGIMTALPPIYW